MGNTTTRRSLPNRHPSVAAVRKARIKYLKELERLDTGHCYSNDTFSGDSTDIDVQVSDLDVVPDNVDLAGNDVSVEDYVFPFENLVLEGGGSKGLTFCGAIKVFEELGLMPQIKRLAGTSAGAIGAALLAVGYTSRGIAAFLGPDLPNIVADHRCGYCSLLPNLVMNYGWNPGKRFYRLLGKVFKEKTGDKNITFQQVLVKFGKELCVVVTNLNQKCPEYCHPKTTPDMPVRLAVRMSMSIPGMFQALTLKVINQDDIVVDGGVSCNFPIHCFDGWWLSMRHGDSFIDRLQPLKDLHKLFEKKERFGDYNDKTVGLLLYSDDEQDLMRTELEKRVGSKSLDLPDTKLARRKQEVMQLQEKADREHRRVAEAWDALLKALKRHNTDRSATISEEELEEALQDETILTKSYKRCIFGDVDDKTILSYLDRDGSGEITFDELQKALDETGVKLRSRFLGYDRTPIKSLSGFFLALQNTMMTNGMRVYVEERDIARTVGINTGHVGTTDFDLEDADRIFLAEQGRKSMLAFLKQYVAVNKPPKKVSPLVPSTESLTTEDVSLSIRM